jgi:molybdate transport system substrate-binding protein
MHRAALAALTASAFAVAGATAPAAADTDVVALIAAVAHGAMTEIVPLYERSHPGTKIDVSYGGAQVLVAEVQAGAPVDLIMVGETALTPIASKISAPVGILAYHEVVLVPKGSKKIHGLRDLADPGVRVALGTANSPPATYAHEVLTKASKAYGADFERKVEANVATTKPSSAEIAAAVKNGLADAAIGFSSDVTDDLEAIPVPADDDVFTVSRAAVVNGAAHAAAAQDFLTFLRGSEAQAIFRKHHLDAPR